MDKVRLLQQAEGKPRAGVIPSEGLDLKALGVLTALALFWGGNSVAMKIALRYMEPFILAGLRFTISLAGVIAWAKLRGVGLRARADELPHLIALGVCFTAQISTFNIGTDLSLASRSSLFINTHPFFVAILAHFLIPTDRLRPVKVLGLASAFLGVFLTLRENLLSSTSYMRGDLILILSALILGVQSIYTKRIVQRVDPAKILAWQMGVGVVLFYLLSLIFEEPGGWRVSGELILAVAYQGLLVGIFCFLIWVTLLRRYSASKLSAFLFTTPIFGVMLSRLILGERLSLWLGAGAALVGLGIYLVNRS